MRDVFWTLVATALAVGVVTWVMTDREAADWRMGAIVVASVCASRAVVVWRRSRREF